MTVTDCSLMDVNLETQIRWRRQYAKELQDPKTAQRFANDLARFPWTLGLMFSDAADLIEALQKERNILQKERDILRF